MRAIVLREIGSVDKLALEKVPATAPGEHQVLIETRAIGLNFPDLLVIEGKYQVLPPLCELLLGAISTSVRTRAA